MSLSIIHLYHIAVPTKKVFEAISTIDGLANWWTTETSGDAGKDGEILFQFGPSGGPTMKVVEFIPNEKIVWECISSPHGWVGNQFTFSLDQNDGKARIRFTHNGWEAQDDFYAACNFTWARYLESLRQYCQTGQGEAFGADTHRS